jgi:hypothetical protein
MDIARAFSSAAHSARIITTITIGGDARPPVGSQSRPASGRAFFNGIIPASPLTETAIFAVLSR